MMMRWLQMIPLVTALLALAAPVSAQLTPPQPTAVATPPVASPPVEGLRCIPDFGYCSGAHPNRHLERRTDEAQSLPICPLGVNNSEAACDVGWRRPCACPPPVVTREGQRVTVDCGGNAQPANNRPRAVSDEVIVLCREDLGLRPDRLGCALQEGLPSGYNYEIVQISRARADGRLTHRLRVSRHAVVLTYAGLAWPNGQDRPQDARFRSQIAGLLEGQTGIQSGVNQNRSEVARAHTRLNDMRPQVQRNTDGVRANRTEVERAHSRIDALPALRLGAGLGGFGIRAPGASDFGGMGLSVSLAYRASGAMVGFIARADFGMGIQPLVPGRDTLWSLFGSAQASFGRGNLLVNAGFAAGALSRGGDAAPGEVTGNTASFIGIALGIELRARSWSIGADFLGGRAQTAALAGDQAVSAVASPFAVGGRAFGQLFF